MVAEIVGKNSFIESIIKMNFLKVFSLIVLFYFCVDDTSAQNISISGQVTEENSATPLIGATVQMGGEATVTDIDGRYSISIPSGNYELIVSYLGYADHVEIIEVRADLYKDIALLASENMLDVTTITGSKYEKNLSESPVSISVIQPRLIENTNMTKMDNLLDRIPGVQMIDGQANIRGGSGYSYGAGSRVLLLIDDVPAFQADAGRPLWDDIPVENIAQVEVLKGASSALYGSAALNGIINIRTGYATSEPETSAFTSYTAYGDPKDDRKKWWTSTPNRLNAGLTHKRKINKLDVVVSGFYEDLDSYYEDTYKKRYRASGNFKYRITPRLTLGVNTMYNYKDDASYLLWKNATSGAYQGWEGTLTAGQTKRFYVDPQLSYTAANGDKHKFISRYYWLQNSSSTQQATASDNFYLEYQYHNNLEKWKTNLVGGVSGYFINSNSELYGSIDLNSKNLAAYIQLEKEIIAGLNITLGSRLEKNIQSNPDVFLGDTLRDTRMDEAKVVSRVALNYKMARATYLRASYGQGYRFPTLAERFIFTSLSALNILPNPSLQSETGATIELGVKQLLAIGDSKGFVDLAFFKSNYNNMMEFVFGEYNDEVGFQSQNVGDISIAGFEANVAGEIKVFGTKLNLLAGYTYLEPKYIEISQAFENTISQPIVEGEDPLFLKYRNRHNAKGDVEMDLYGFSLGYTINYTSPTVTVDQFLENLNEIRQYRQLNDKGYTKMDARLSYTLRNYKLSALVENLTNTEYMVRPGLLEAPRNYSLRLDFKF